MPMGPFSSSLRSAYHNVHIRRHQLAGAPSKDWAGGGAQAAVAEHMAAAGGGWGRHSRQLGACKATWVLCCGMLAPLYAAACRRRTLSGMPAAHANKAQMKAPLLPTPTCVGSWRSAGGRSGWRRCVQAWRRRCRASHCPPASQPAASQKHGNQVGRGRSAYQAFLMATRHPTVMHNSCLAQQHPAAPAHLDGLPRQQLGCHPPHAVPAAIVAQRSLHLLSGEQRLPRQPLLCKGTVDGSRSSTGSLSIHRKHTGRLARMTAAAVKASGCGFLNTTSAGSNERRGCASSGTPSFTAAAHSETYCWHRQASMPESPSAQPAGQCAVCMHGVCGVEWRSAAGGSRRWCRVACEHRLSSWMICAWPPYAAASHRGRWGRTLQGGRSPKQRSGDEGAQERSQKCRQHVSLLCRSTARPPQLHGCNSRRGRCYWCFRAAAIPCATITAGMRAAEGAACGAAPASKRRRRHAVGCRRDAAVGATACKAAQRGAQPCSLCMAISVLASRRWTADWPNMHLS